MPQSSYPIMLDVSERLCVIIGGGAVAVRKARGLIDAGARRVHFIAPLVSSEVPEIARVFREPYRPEHLEGAGVVFAATNISQVNDAVVRDCQARSILVSRADGDDEFPGDFVSVAQFGKGPVTVAVSAGSAALSVMIRDALSAKWDSRWTAAAEMMVTLRPEIKQRWDEQTRRKIFRDVATGEAMDVLLNGGLDALRDWINGRYGGESGAGK